MTLFEEQEKGAWLVVPTTKALWFADGNHDKIVAVCFAALLRSWNLPMIWSPDAPLVVRVGVDDIGCRADRGSDPWTVTVPKAEEHWTLIGRVLSDPQGSPQLVLLIGLTASQLNDRETLPLTAPLSLNDWRAQFKPFQKGEAA